MTNQIDQYTTLNSIFQAEQQAKSSQLCSDNQCGMISKCTSDPYQTCAQYATAQVCTNNQSTCSNMTVTCKTVTQECILEQGSCSDYADVCQEYEYTCSGNSTYTCMEYTNVTNTTDCLVTTVACEEEQVPDTTCSQACEVALQTYNYYTSILSVFNTSLNGLSDQFAQVHSANETVLEINSWSVNTALNQQMTSDELVWNLDVNFTCNSTNTEKVLQVTGMNLNDADDISEKIFLQLSSIISNQFGFDPTLVSESNSNIQNIEQAIAVLESM
eukprot:CAMPEP_0176426268 /NCGR_PEP_ID=MMETSP0127-20121128/11845_1 /TAXON_ID=938130 /ORGANISM="Platyophrya macrostoma, Strain WH" /LENGTH=272 /DNA_ID=CAMNT_0017807511 /DNA_START=61 /DNA_END=879 /DNA_ORIENTATION=-